MALREQKLIPPVDYDAWLWYAASLLKTPGGAAVWVYYQKILTPPIRDLLLDYLKRNPDMKSFIEVVPIFDTRHAATA